MPHKNNKFGAFVLVIIINLLLLEIFLRIVGFAYQRKASPERIIKRDKNQYVILCLGDSFTYGIGSNEDGYDTAPGRSYPEQLEALLNKNVNGLPVRVVNGGRPGMTTATIFDEFEEQLKETKPNLIILLAGTNNTTNPYGYSNYLRQKTLSYTLRNFLCSMKVYKLIKYLSADLKNKNSQAPEECVDLSSRKPNKQKKHPALRQAQKDWNARNQLAHQLTQEGKLQEAILAHEKNLEKWHYAHDAAFSYGCIANLYFRLGQREESRRYYQLAIDADPICYSHYYVAYMQNFVLDQELSEQDLHFLKKYTQVNSRARDVLGQIVDQQRYYKEFKSWLTADIDKMVVIAKRQGIRIVLQNYPWGGWMWKTAYVNLILRDIAQKLTVPFVDQEKIFEEMFPEGENKRSYFAFDNNHCNAKGYGVMAENIYRYIHENNLLE
jgi:lysophospholipase L1-like esterase